MQYTKLKNMHTIKRVLLYKKNCDTLYTNKAVIPKEFPLCISTVHILANSTKTL